MRQIRDLAQYEALEIAMASALINGIRTELEEAGIGGDALRATVQAVAFSVAAIYDGSAHVPVGDDHVVPMLGFAVGRMRERLLLPAEGGSSVHEFIPGAAAVEFGDELPAA